MQINKLLSDYDISSELLKDENTEKFCSEFHRAKSRFSECFGSGRMNEEKQKLDEIINKLCLENVSQIVDITTDLFFEILFRADFLQISDDVRNHFYRNICIFFVFSDIVSGIVNQVDNLDLIPHVKIDISKTVLQILNVGVFINKHCLTLKYIPKRINYNQVHFCHIDHIIVSPCAYKIMFSNDKVNFHHLNLILKSFEVKKLTLNGCNLNWKSEGNPLQNLSLSHLYMAECGSSVNYIIQENFETLKDSLRVLDISACPLYNETLTVIRNFRLIKLCMRNCVMKKGYFVGDLWSEAIKFGSYVEANENINLLWQEGDLKDTIRYLDVSFNELGQKELDKMNELPVEELNLTSTNIKLDIQCMNGNTLNFPYCLKKLILKDVDISFIVLSILCDIRLQRLEISYDAAKEFDDFSLLLNKPIIESLEELSLDLKNYSQLFVTFIANFKLIFFECKLRTWYYYNFDSFWYDSNREYLKVLILEDGKLSESDAEGIGRLNLKILSIHPFLFDTKQHILKILSSENLGNSVSDLRLGGAYETDNEHINLISNFKNLEYLSLKITGKNLTKLLFKKLELLGKLKNLRLKVCIGLNINEEAASVLCHFPVKTELTILMVGVGRNWCLSFTENAFHEFLKNTSINPNTEVTVRLEFSDCTLDKRCAEVFKHFYVESVIFSSCVFDNFLETFLKDEMVFSLQDLTLKRVDIDDKQLELLTHIHLSRLSILTSNNFSYINLPLVLINGPISKSLTTLRIGPSTCIHYMGEILKTKLSVYGLNSWDFL